MSNSHYKDTVYCNPNLCHGGLIPASEIGSALAQSYQTLKSWKRNELLAQYIGPAQSDYSGGQQNRFYIITPVEAPIDTNQTTRKIGMFAKRWNYDFWTDPGGGADYENNVRWNGSQLDDYTETIRSQYLYTGSEAQSRNEPAAGPTAFWFAEATQDTGDSQYSSGFRYDLLQINDISFANFTAFTLPEWTLTTAAAGGLVPGNFTPGSVARGYAGTTDTGTSLGALVNNIDATDGILSNTKRCVAQWCHPGGSYIIHTNSTPTYYSFLENATGGATITLKCKGRNLRGRSTFSNSTSNLDFAMVALWDTGAKIKLESATQGDTYTATLPGSATGAVSLHVIQDAITYDPAGDFLSVKFEVTDAIAVEVKSFCFYEKSNSDEV